VIFFFFFIKASGANVAPRFSIFPRYLRPSPILCSVENASAILVAFILSIREFKRLNLNLLFLLQVPLLPQGAPVPLLDAAIFPPLNQFPLWTSFLPLKEGSTSADSKQGPFPDDNLYPDYPPPSKECALCDMFFHLGSFTKIVFARSKPFFFFFRLTGKANAT